MWEIFLGSGLEVKPITYAQIPLAKFSYMTMSRRKGKWGVEPSYVTKKKRIKD